MTETERKLLDAVNNGNVDVVKELLKEPGVHVDCLDDQGMTPLQHAAFRAKKEVCELLLAHGADVNSNYHKDRYSCLMFAALSGSKEMTRLMLDSGAKIDHVNNVGRTASQMAAFVGQHNVVFVINNFFPKEDLYYYTVPTGLETEARLPSELAPAMLKFINMSNLHPVKLSLYLNEHPGMLKCWYKVVKVLELLCQNSMRSKDTNDILAMKMHYFSVVVKRAAQSYQEENDNLNPWIKKLLNGRHGDGFPEFMERFIRQVLKEFPFSESTLLHTMVKLLADVTIGHEPTAFSTMAQGINGQRSAFEDNSPCGTCGEFCAEKKCSACKSVSYCNQVCQKLHWFTHKKFCKLLGEEMKRMEELRIQREKEELARQEQEDKELEEEDWYESEGEEDKENKKVVNGEKSSENKGNQLKSPDTPVKENKEPAETKTEPDTS
ncbi:hypothetical protein ScPMuIL_012642 [Solemya velum]